jgi:hypothetical protein
VHRAWPGLSFRGPESCAIPSCHGRSTHAHRPSMHADVSVVAAKATNVPLHELIPTG